MTIPQDPSIASELKSAMRAFAKSVVIITVRGPDRAYAMAASAVDCLTLEPPTMLICVNRNSSIWMPLASGAGFAINLLAATQVDLAVQCSTGAHGEARFGLGRWAGEEGPPVLEDALASIVCDQRTSVTFGTHQLFIGTVRAVVSDGAIDPLVHANGAYHRLGLAV